MKVIFKNFIMLLLVVVNFECLAKSHSETEIDQIIYNKNSVVELDYNAGAKLILEIGYNSHTRICFNPYQISEVVGDNSKFKLIRGVKAKNIFILPKAKEGEVIDITIITNNGKTQDLSFKISNGEGKTIYIKDDTTKNIESLMRLEEAKNMLTVMSRGGNGKYAVKDYTHKGKSKGLLIYPENNPKLAGSSRDINYYLNRDIEIRENKVYSYNIYKLKGIVINIENKGKSSITFNDKIFANIFAGILIVSLGRNNISDLKPGESLLAYAVIDNNLLEH